MISLSHKSGDFRYFGIASELLTFENHHTLSIRSESPGFQLSARCLGKVFWIRIG